MQIAAVTQPPFTTFSESTAMNIAPSADILRAMALNTDATISEDARAEGEPTEAALLQYAYDASPDLLALQLHHPHASELPFSSERGRMTTHHHGDDGLGLVVMKGAPERVLEHCVEEWRDGDDSAGFRGTS